MALLDAGLFLFESFRVMSDEFGTGDIIWKM